MGRTEELVALRDAFDAAADGFVVTLIGGDPGVGKTALARAFSQELRDGGVAVHWGRCVEIGGAPAFWPWMQVLRSVGDDAFEAARDGLAARADEPFAAYDAVHEVLRHQRGERLVLVLDDLHRADLPSLELLRFLTTAGTDLPILVVGTHRVHELRVDRARDVVLAAVADAGRRISPSALGLDDVAELLARRVADGPDRAVAAEVLARSGGNALYVEQLVDAVGRGGREELAEIPGGIRAAVRARLEPLHDDTRRLLAAASVLGPGFRPEVLGAVVGLPVAEVRAQLEPALAAGVLGAAGDELAFTHALIRDTLDDELEPEARSAAHGAAARALAHRGDGVPAAVIAQHLLDAGSGADAAEVAHWAEQAAVGARRLSGHREAGRWAEVAATHWGRAGDLAAQGRSLVHAIGDRVTVGDGAAAVALSDGLAQLARQAGSGHLLAAAALARSDVFDPTIDFDVPPLIREALGHPDLRDEPDRRADLLGGLASILGMPSIDGFRRDQEGALAAIAELEVLAEGGSPRAQGQLALARLNVFSGPEHHEARVGWLREHEALLPAGPNVLARIQHLYWATSLAFESGDLFEVDRLLREWELLADRSDSRFWTWRASMARASLTYARPPGPGRGASDLPSRPRLDPAPRDGHAGGGRPGVHHPPGRGPAPGDRRPRGRHPRGAGGAGGRRAGRPRRDPAPAGLGGGRGALHRARRPQLALPALAHRAGGRAGGRRRAVPVGGRPARPLRRPVRDVGPLVRVRHAGERGHRHRPSRRRAAGAGGRGLPPRHPLGRPLRGCGLRGAGSRRAGLGAARRRSRAPRGGRRGPRHRSPPRLRDGGGRDGPPARRSRGH
ncbi:AAA family ATPase [Aquihabitans sp. G128]|uniref:ATP-binding protein n=1 Tax=Aquihabitans sp. G128 TaxID=2849779 RepID=UPI001C221B34|nr:AAA family ATPase [Aquihabitans sp. G128]QXC63134.1 AAA family ATPase [Aquihabitans sp. G128]